MRIGRGRTGSTGRLASSTSCTPPFAVDPLATASSWRSLRAACWAATVSRLGAQGLLFCRSLARRGDPVVEIVELGLGLLHLLEEQPPGVLEIGHHGVTSLLDVDLGVGGGAVLGDLAIGTLDGDADQAALAHGRHPHGRYRLGFRPQLLRHLQRHGPRLDDLDVGRHVGAVVDRPDTLDPRARWWSRRRAGRWPRTPWWTRSRARPRPRRPRRPPRSATTAGGPAPFRRRAAWTQQWVATVRRYQRHNKDLGRRAVKVCGRGPSLDLLVRRRLRCRRVGRAIPRRRPSDRARGAGPACRGSDRARDPDGGGHAGAQPAPGRRRHRRLGRHAHPAGRQRRLLGRRVHLHRSSLRRLRARHRQRRHSPPADRPAGRGAPRAVPPGSAGPDRPVRRAGRAGRLPVGDQRAVRRRRVRARGRPGRGAGGHDRAGRLLARPHDNDDRGRPDRCCSSWPTLRPVQPAGPSRSPPT